MKKAQLHGGDSSNHPFMSGIVSRHDGDWIVVSTKSKHMLLIEKVLDKKEIDNFLLPDFTTNFQKESLELLNHL